MGKNKQKYYVVWAGKTTGIFDNWKDCQKSVEGFDGARYMSFENIYEARKAFEGDPNNYIGKKKPPDPKLLKQVGKPIADSISVDAACSMPSGNMEYQGVYTANKKVLFHQGPYPQGSNNIGEFLAIVHALAWCKKNNITLPIYTDSRNAMAWVRKKKANTNVIPTAENRVIFDLIQRAEQWLVTNNWTNKILKWETEAWGEIPADFGRK
jgi:ribonuclease HI